MRECYTSFRCLFAIKCISKPPMNAWSFQIIIPSSPAEHDGMRFMCPSFPVGVPIINKCLIESDASGFCGITCVYYSPYIDKDILSKSRMDTNY